MLLNSMTCCKLKELFLHENVGSCKINTRLGHKRSQYAAIDSHISHRELPIIDRQNFASENFEADTCIKPDFSLCATILAIVGTFSNVGNLIFFVDNVNILRETLDIISSFRMKYSAGTTISICKSVTQDEGFVVTAHETHTTYTVSENQMLSIVNSITSNEKSMIFYMYDGSVGYSNAIQISSKCIWISAVSEILNMSGMCGNRFLPIFYRRSDDIALLSMNVGPPTIDINISKHKIKPQFNGITSEAISATSKDGLCYYCAYLESVHSHLCTEKRIEFSTKLLGKFSNIAE